MPPFLTLHHPKAAASHYETGLWQNDTFYGLLRDNAAISSNAVALVDGLRTFTWKELLNRVDGMAADLCIYELRPGDRVCGWMSDRAEMLITMLACSRQGFAMNPSLHRNYTAREVASLMKQLSARALVMEEGWGVDVWSENVNAILADVESLKVIYMPENFPQGGPNLTSWNTDPDKVAYLAHTSGSTGAPKCVMHSANTLLANARDLVRDWHHHRDTVIYSLSPVSHHIAWVGFAQWLLTGGRFVLNSPAPGRSTLDWILETGATYVMGVPTHALDLLSEEARRGVGFGKVEVFYLAGSLIPPDLCEALLAHGVRPQNVYGMTENSSHQYTLPQDPPEVIVTTCGRGGRAYQVRIVDKDDSSREVATGTIGQIAGKGAALMLGYFDNQTATEQSFNHDGWFLSGDLGYVDAHGNLHIVGRLKDTIIRGGHNIFPVHVETIARRHPDIWQAACVAVPDKRLGERMCLVICGTVEKNDLLGFLSNQGISKYDMPEFFLRLDEFPMLPSGKIAKRIIEEKIRENQLQPQAITRAAVRQLSSVASS